MVSTPITELDRDIVQDQGWDKTHSSIEMGRQAHEMGKRRAATEAGVLSSGIVVIQIVESFGKEFLPVVDLEDPGDIELVIIGAMGSLQVGVFLGMFEMVLDQLAAKTREQLS